MTTATYSCFATTKETNQIFKKHISSLNHNFESAVLFASILNLFCILYIRSTCMTTQSYFYLILKFIVRL